jgi:hypothetical protein
MVGEACRGRTGKCGTPIMPVLSRNIPNFAHLDEAIEQITDGVTSLKESHQLCCRGAKVK